MTGKTKARIIALRIWVRRRDKRVMRLLLLTFLLFAVWFFLRQALVRTLGADRQAFWTAFCAVTFVMVQFVPELSEAFFWFNGGVAYTLLWAVAMVRLGVWL